MTAIDNWIADLNAAKYSDFDQNLISKVAVAIAALQQIQAGLAPAGPEAKNTFFAGPITGANALPGFRAIDPADLTTPLLTPPPIGITTPAPGSFTTLGATGLISPASAIGILGTTTNDNAQAGSIGEYLSSNIASPGAGLASATNLNVTSIPLTAGDWEAWGTVGFVIAGTTTASSLQGWINTVSATQPVTDSGNGAFAIFSDHVTGNSGPTMPVGRTRISLAAAGTAFLSVRANFAISTISAFGFLAVRRMR